MGIILEDRYTNESATLATIVLYYTPSSFNVIVPPKAVGLVFVSKACLAWDMNINPLTQGVAKFV